MIPSQTLVQRRMPPEFIGRVLGFRFSLVFGSTTLAMGVGGNLGQAFGAARDQRDLPLGHGRRRPRRPPPTMREA